MYLKSIEIHGFKSFANKMTLKFHDGITGIVGPNGSGKSNIADAVRWVLGEQSAKQLRGAKMEDVIFSGTQTRKPLGYAYVAITMDNSDHKLSIDYDEVTVARRVYRSGESEYLINGNTCRLKDVNELFLDTGIGKEGYSIIGQGQIDKILSGKPEDRRELFDEAAGIVKFKRRKYAAEKNLEEEKQNLYRITDIIGEIEKQLVPLEKQSLVAKNFIKLKEELKSLEINQFLQEYDKIRISKNEVEEKLTIAKHDLEQANIEYEKTKEEYIQLEKQLEDCDSIIEEDKNHRNERKLALEKAEGEIKVLKEQIHSIQQNDAYYQNRIQSNQKDLEAKKEEALKYRNDREMVGEKLHQLKTQWEQAGVELNTIKENIHTYTHEIEECNNAIFDYLNVNSNIKSNMQRYQTMLEQNNLRKAEINQKILKNKSEDSLYDETIQHWNGILETISSQISNHSNQKRDMEQKIEETQTAIDQISIRYNDLHQQYLRGKSRLESLVNLTERYDGYGNSIRRVMEKKATMPGILGVVADLVKVDKRFETAIETALGGTIQNIVTKDEKTAKDLISYLKENKYGRATFLPLTNISANNTLQNSPALKEHGVIGVASQLVDSDPEYHELIQYLLGRIIVVDHINHATILARKYRYSLRIVTLEGELLNPGGSLSGGAYKNTSNLLGRRREIEDLELQVKKLEDETRALLQQKEINKENKSKLRQKLDELTLVLQEKYLEQNTAKINLDREISKKAEAEAVYQEYMQEVKEIESQAVELNQQLNQLKDSLANHLEQSQEKEQQIEVLNKQLELEREEEHKVNEQISSIKLELSSFEQNNQFLLENINRIQREIEKLNQEEDSLRTDIQKASAFVEEKKQTILSTEAAIETNRKQIEDIEEKITNNQKQKENITQNHKNFFAKREELSNQIRALDKECFRLNSQKEKLMEQADSQMNYMWEEYELTYSTASEFPMDTELSLSQLQKEIKELKAKIKDLGDVNVNAIEDYKNLSERYEFLQVQRDDLLKAEETLLEIIRELDTEMRKQFEEKFAAIKEQFDVVFKELFGGGKADLELTEHDDILEAGIRINAQPPGKKLQNMMQLSGGEKALTAISLLFAIQNLKPSPFCLLDEIEAALDDSNVNRYAKYLNKLTKDTQFIIITHRRGTMAAADILYGITMQEKGVSTLVSVNLIEDELEK